MLVYDEVAPHLYGPAGVAKEWVLIQQIAGLIQPFTCWEFVKDFITRDRGVPHVINTVAHELGHLLHLDDVGPVLLDGEDGELTRFLAQLPEERRIKSELEARATNYLVCEFYGIKNKWVYVPGQAQFMGADMPLDSDVLKQIKEARTVAVATKVCDYLMSKGVWTEPSDAITHSHWGTKLRD
jgi:hypothetical protein